MLPFARMSLRDRLRRARPLLPWVSLGSGLASAAIMNRAPERAWIVVVAAFLGWAALAAFQVIERAAGRGSPSPDDGADAERPSSSGRRRFAALLAAQLAVQQALLFPLPGILRAARMETGHVAFLALYACALAVALWDPLFERVMRRAPGALVLQAFGAFVGLATVLPVFGLANQTALWAAAGVTSLGVPVLLALEHRRAGAVHRLWALPAMALIVVTLRILAPAIPPAPLELVHVGIGTGVRGRALIGASAVFDGASTLVCHSTIKAPLGLRDALVHVWSQDGEERDRIVVEVSGGRDTGYRTWSRKRTLGDAPQGLWTCAVKTPSGQTLGSATATLR